ncbi:PAS domain S-box-containing protein/diguanylate cyclase (GGDEF) domain-containing protein [Oceanospirillum multiglobuliferum]|uniref:GGDEF domain-containing protein n=1 Tax=Oceanospirillum multiglobuliferum TaxID=64969 RepID=A0A1T4P5P4_9GAMM|nr:GGDEF domain-containing phosphodiesterase [Oceanospirillum multiglobuliferum]OPX54848.1 hypothetical protein BTE48_12080 [Oceanospirillum multiglobuliferum]SJZ86762.1 PAS domain S-box-containing protein/diguanylate cyclase (GGDEF) domain-containing protein [Oceanospirillum multiglobuliferum]
MDSDYAQAVCPSNCENHNLQSVLAEVRARLQQETLRHQETAERLDLISHVVNKAHFSVMITDADQQILYINEAYTRLTGLSFADVKGKTPKINQSGRHKKEFYRNLWLHLLDSGYWEGEIWDKRPDSSYFMKHLAIEAIKNEQGITTHYFSISSDLSEQKRTEEELERLTHYDPLTNLPNRILFRNRLGHEFLISNRHNSRTGLLLMNLDRFKIINDAFGFAAGDQLLVQVAERLRHRVRGTDLLARQEQRTERDSDLVSRIGGDDFSFILSELRAPEDAAVVARRLLSAFIEPFEVCGEDIYLSASLGIAIYPDNAKNEDALLQCSETALDLVKIEGKGGYRFFAEDLNISSAHRVRLEARLHRAVEKQEFELYYQPKLDLKTKELVGMEALLRWPQNDGSMISPAEFISVAEDTGLINPIGQWIIQQAIEDTLKINAQRQKPMQIAINLSVRQFRNPALISTIAHFIRSSDINPALIEFEITESMLMDKVDEARQAMANLRQLGVQLAIDDFGTGYSSLAYLRQFPVNTLKIDQSFIADLDDNDESSKSIVNAVIGLGVGLKLKVVAEGIETEEQMNLLSKAGCHIGQGFHIARPMPFDQLLKYG